MDSITTRLGCCSQVIPSGNEMLQNTKLMLMEAESPSPPTTSVG